MSLNCTLLPNQRPYTPQITNTTWFLGRNANCFPAYYFYVNCTCAFMSVLVLFYWVFLLAKKGMPTTLSNVQHVLMVAVPAVDVFLLIAFGLVNFHYDADGVHDTVFNYWLSSFFTYLALCVSTWCLVQIVFHLVKNASIASTLDLNFVSEYDLILLHRLVLAALCIFGCISLVLVYSLDDNRFFIVGFAAVLVVMLYLIISLIRASLLLRSGLKKLLPNMNDIQSRELDTFFAFCGTLVMIAIFIIILCGFLLQELNLRDTNSFSRAYFYRFGTLDYSLLVGFLACLASCIYLHRMESFFAARIAGNIDVGAGLRIDSLFKHAAKPLNKPTSVEFSGYVARGAEVPQKTSDSFVL